MEWLLGLSLLSETSALIEEIDSVAVLYELLLPWAAVNSELITAALETYRELGMESHAARAQVLVESHAGVRFTQL